MNQERVSGGETRCGPSRAPGFPERRDFSGGVGPRYPPDRLADVRHVRLELTIVPEKRSLIGTARITLAPIGAPLRRVGFDLCELTVDAVRLGDRALSYHHEGGRLELQLPKAQAVGRECEVTIEYHGSPRTGLNFTGPDHAYPDRPYQAWTQGQDEYARYWFPAHDFPNQKSTFEFVVTAPEAYQTIANGALIKVEKRGRNRSWHWRQEVPQSAYLASVVVGKFEHWSDDLDGIPVEYYVPPGRRADGERALSSTPAMIRAFAEFTGQPYPYDKYAQVVVRDFTWGGMENTSATTLVDQVIHDERAAADYGLIAERLVAHELAHQWFGDYLTCRDWAEAWLNEGFATYFETLWAEARHGFDMAQWYRHQKALTYFDEDAEYRRPIVCRTYPHPHALFDRHLYEKGALVLWMLRKVVGDDLFRDSLRAYVAANRAALVTTDNLQRAFEDTTGRSLGWFFDQWVHGGGHPEFEVRYEWDDERGAAQLKVRQTQQVDDLTHVFFAPMVIAFGQPGGRAPVLCEVEVGADGRAEESFSFALPHRPTWVRFDRENRVLKRLSFDRPAELLIAQLREDEPTGAVEAATELGRVATPAAVEALAGALGGKAFFAVRTAAASALGVAMGEAAREALVGALGRDPEAAVRAAAATALGAFIGEEKVGKALEKAIGDRAYSVAASAARALGRTRCRNALPALRRAMKIESHRDVIRVQALAGMVELTDPGLMTEILAYTRPPHWSRLREAALREAATLARRLPVERRRVVSEAAEAALRDPLYFVRLGGIGALRILDDPAAISALEALASRDAEGAVKEEVKLAVQALRTSTRHGEEVAEVRRELEGLRRDYNDVRGRLEKLEPATRRRRK
ncbi:MAG: M1 family aminopeptidase [Candidatus Dormibacteria bacterium]